MSEVEDGARPTEGASPKPAPALPPPAPTGGASTLPPPAAPTPTGAPPIRTAVAPPAAPPATRDWQQQGPPGSQPISHSAARSNSSVAWGVVALAAAAAMVVATFASWTTEFTFTPGGFLRAWLLSAAAIAALGGIGMLLNYRDGAGVSAGALLLFAPFAAWQIHGVIDFGDGLGSGLVALGAAGTAAVALTVATLLRASPRISGPVGVEAVVIAAAGGALLAVGQFLVARDVWLEDDVWFDALQIAIVALPAVAALLVAVLRSRAVAAFALGVAATFAGIWTAQAFYDGDVITSYVILRGVAIGVLAFGAALGALGPSPRDEEAASQPGWVFRTVIATFGATFAFAIIGYHT